MTEQEQQETLKNLANLRQMAWSCPDPDKFSDYELISTLLTFGWHEKIPQLEDILRKTENLDLIEDIFRPCVKYWVGLHEAKLKEEKVEVPAWDKKPDWWDEVDPKYPKGMLERILKGQIF
jgi:hypothetical protein